MKKRLVKTQKTALAFVLSAALIIVGSFVGASGTANADDGDQTVTDTALDANNLVTNGNFADGTTGWGTDNCEITVTVVDGSNVALISDRGNNYAAIIQDLNGPFQKGDVLDYSFKIKRAAQPDNNKYFELCLKYNDTSIDRFPSVIKNSDNEEHAYCHTDHWTTLSGTHTVEEAAPSIQINIREPGYQDYADNKSSHDFYIDDVQIVRTFAATPPPPTPVPTPRVTRTPKPTATPKVTATPTPGGNTTAAPKTTVAPGTTNAPDGSRLESTPVPTSDKAAVDTVSELKVSGKKTITLKLSNKKKKSAKLSAALINLKGTVKWKVIKGKKIIKLNKQKGNKIKITAIKTGRATIRITCKGLKVDRKVIVKK